MLKCKRNNTKYTVCGKRMTTVTSNDLTKD